MPIKSVLFIALFAIASAAFQARAGEPGPYPEPHYTPYPPQYPDQGYLPPPAYQQPGVQPPFYPPSFQPPIYSPAYRPPATYFRHKKTYYHEETEVFRPDRSYYCRGACSAPPFFPGRPPLYPVPLPYQFACGVCFLNPIGGGFFDLILNGRPLFRGPGFSAVQMFNYYRAARICLN